MGSTPNELNELITIVVALAGYVAAVRLAILGKVLEARKKKDADVISRTLMNAIENAITAHSDPSTSKEDKARLRKILDEGTTLDSKGDREERYNNLTLQAALLSLAAYVCIAAILFVLSGSAEAAKWSLIVILSFLLITHIVADCGLCAIYSDALGSLKQRCCKRKSSSQARRSASGDSKDSLADKPTPVEEIQTNNGKGGKG